MKKILFVLIGLLVIFGIWFYIRHPLGTKAVINGHTIFLELALTDSEKERGLGYRDSLLADHGMLFVYPNRDRYGYWMKGMRFPLDFIWIDGNKVVDLSENVPAPPTVNDKPVELSPLLPVDKVLEVNAGTIQSLGIRIGDTIKLSN